MLQFSSWKLPKLCHSQRQILTEAAIGITTVTSLLLFPSLHLKVRYGEIAAPRRSRAYRCGIIGPIFPSRQPVTRRHTSMKFDPDSPSDWWQQFITENPVPQDLVAYFASIDWTNKYLSNPLYETIPSFSRILKPDGEDQFFAETINSPTTITRYICLKRKDLETATDLVTNLEEPSTSSTGRKAIATPPENPDCNFLLSIGHGGLDGHPGVMHGGMCSAILDETIGFMIVLHVRKMEGRTRKSHAYTIYLNTTYRAQVPTSSDILVRTWLTKKDGRKWSAMGQIVDKNGTVCTEAECLYILVPKQKL